MKNLLLLSLSAAALVAAPAVANAPVDTRSRVQSGSLGDLNWTARSLIVGMTPTADTPTTGGGNPLFFPGGNRNGVVALIMEYDNGAFICSGSLMNDRRSILTAGHCVSDGVSGGQPLGLPNKTTAWFFNGDPNVRTPFLATGVSIEVESYFVNAGYTGQVIDHNDIAVLRLKSAAPDEFLSYGLYTTPELRGLDATFASYGGRTTATGGIVGANAQTGWLREGDNMYDYRMGDPIFNNGWAGIFPANPNLAFSYISDFDSGLPINDQSCRVAQAANLAQAAGAVFCNTGRGPREIGIAGGDSGGPGFIGNLVATVNSYGLSFGPAWGDCRAGLQSSCGELFGTVPVYYHAQWIQSVLVPGSGVIPEPATWAMMIAGFGAVGLAARRRRRTAVAA